MAQSFSCKCEERKKPIDKRNWVVVHYKHNHSAFESPKYFEHYSKWSTVMCNSCGKIGRTKAAYVEDIPLENGGVGHVVIC